MAKKILITGGAGFIGSHLSDELLKQGYDIRVLDRLSPQVHGKHASRPEFLAKEVELIKGDICNPDVVWKALDGVTAVYHFAAAVGVGQSMYQMESYTDVNARGTAILLEALAKRPVERLIVASSMSIYGEGLYRAIDGRRIEGKERSLSQLQSRKWDILGTDGEPLLPIPTPETKCPGLPSVYALSKYYQERMCLTVGRAYRIPTVALRFFNVYGTRQALSNPYTGVLAIFASRLLNGKAPLINEDGRQRRDFVNVRDVVQACRLALEVPEAAEHVFNVGSGESYSVSQIAEMIASSLGRMDIEPEITGRYRVGDIRNCFADITLAKQLLGYKPKVSLQHGLEELAEWVEYQSAEDRVPFAAQELLARGLAA